MVQKHRPRINLHRLIGLLPVLAVQAFKDLYDDQCPAEMKLTCPTLSCEDSDSDLSNKGDCFKHDGEQTVAVMKGSLCYDVSNASQTDPVYVCPFNLNEFMWIDEILQGQGADRSNMCYDFTSQVEKRKKVAKCLDAGSLKNNLNPGRSCTVASQCKSRDCRNVCVGYETMEACHKHEDCVEGTYCHDTSEWPFKSLCKPHKGDQEVCEEDYQCGITHYCWFASKEDKTADTRRCLEIYSQEVGTTFGWKGGKQLSDYTQNGKFCKSGLAFQVASGQAKCTQTNKIMFDSQELTSPYACTATDPNKRCKIVFEADTPKEDYVDVLCRCSLSDQSSGFCESVIGTEIYEKASRGKKLLYQKSACHTLDRDNMRAQRDKCGIGDYTDEWRFAIDQQFNVTHWPYVQDKETYHCVQKFFADSYVNESLDQAVFGVSFAAAVSVLGLLAQIFF